MSTVPNRDIRPFEKVHYLYEKVRHVRGSIIIFEGIIGAGKTTISSSLTDLLKRVNIPVQFFDEKVDPHMLRLFLSDMKRYAFTFQMYMLVERQKIYMKAVDFARIQGGVSIVDRSLHGDLAFASLHHEYGNITDEEWKAYTSVLTGTTLPQPSNIIFLEVTPEVALNRIKSRNREGEASTYTTGYLYDLDINYRVSMEETNIPIQYLEWNESRILTDDDLVDICKLIDPHQ